MKAHLYTISTILVITGVVILIINYPIILKYLGITLIGILIYLFIYSWFIEPNDSDDFYDDYY